MYIFQKYHIYRGIQQEEMGNEILCACEGPCTEGCGRTGVFKRDDPGPQPLARTSCIPMHGVKKAILNTTESEE